MDVKTVNKRTSRRYTYLPQARVDAPKISEGIQVRDVSHSGMQFFSNLVINVKTPLIATWTEPAVGPMTPFLMIIRKVEQQPGGVFKFCYGTQFFNLRQETKLKLDKLLIQTKAEENAANKNLIQRIKVETIIQIIQQGRVFLENVIKTNDPLFYRFTRDLKDYEKNSFKGTGDTEQMIQKLTMHNFHCNLLNISIPLVPKNNAQGFELYKNCVKKIELMNDAILEARKLEDSKFVHESKTRLYYNKLELLQTFVDTYESDGSSTKDESVQKIVTEYRSTSPKPRR